MFVHLLLGLLRDGESRHGYELMSEYRARSGNQPSAGSFYRVLARLAEQGLVKTGINPPDADARRIPYRITDKGSQLFDQWVVSPVSGEGISERLIFVDRVPPEALTRLLNRWQEDLWLRGKTLARMHEDALHRHPPDGRYDPLPALLSRRMKQVEADLEFLKEFRMQFDEWLRERRDDAAGQPLVDASGREERVPPAVIGRGPASREAGSTTR